MQFQHLGKSEIVDTTYCRIFTDIELQMALAQGMGLEEFLFGATPEPSSEPKAQPAAPAKASKRGGRQSKSKAKPAARAKASKRMAVNWVVCPVGGEKIKTLGSTRHVQKHGREGGWSPTAIDSAVRQLKDVIRPQAAVKELGAAELGAAELGAAAQNAATVA